MLYCPNCQCQHCIQQSVVLAQKMIQAPRPTQYAVKPTLTCWWCKSEHDTFEELQWCRRTIDERTRQAFEEAAIAAWELLEELRPDASESDHSCDPQNQI